MLVATAAVWSTADHTAATEVSLLQTTELEGDSNQILVDATQSKCTDGSCEGNKRYIERINRRSERHENILNRIHSKVSKLRNWVRNMFSRVNKPRRAVVRVNRSRRAGSRANRQVIRLRNRIRRLRRRLGGCRSRLCRRKKAIRRGLKKAGRRSKKMSARKARRKTRRTIRRVNSRLSSDNKYYKKLEEAMKDEAKVFKELSSAFDKRPKPADAKNSTIPGLKSINKIETLHDLRRTAIDKKNREEVPKAYALYTKHKKNAERTQRIRRKFYALYSAAIKENRKVASSHYKRQFAKAKAIGRRQERAMYKYFKKYVRAAKKWLDYRRWLVIVWGVQVRVSKAEDDSKKEFKALAAKEQRKLLAVRKLLARHKKDFYRTRALWRRVQKYRRIRLRKLNERRRRMLNLQRRRRVRSRRPRRNVRSSRRRSGSRRSYKLRKKRSSPRARALSIRRRRLLRSKQRHRLTRVFRNFARTTPRVTARQPSLVLETHQWSTRTLKATDDPKKMFDNSIKGAGFCRIRMNQLYKVANDAPFGYGCWGTASKATAYKLTVQFVVTKAGSWQFSLKAPNAVGVGFAIDGKPAGKGKLEIPAKPLKGKDAKPVESKATALKPGKHTLEVYSFVAKPSNRDFTSLGFKIDGKPSKYAPVTRGHISRLGRGILPKKGGECKGPSTQKKDICCGILSRPNFPQYTNPKKRTIIFNVDTRKCGFTNTPMYFTSLVGRSSADIGNTGAGFNFSPTKKNFRLGIYLPNSNPRGRWQPKNNQIRWCGIGSTKKPKRQAMCCGTERKGWSFRAVQGGGRFRRRCVASCRRRQCYRKNGRLICRGESCTRRCARVRRRFTRASLRVDMSKCQFKTTPSVFTSLTDWTNRYAFYGVENPQGLSRTSFTVKLQKRHSGFSRRTNSAFSRRHALSWCAFGTPRASLAKKNKGKKDYPCEHF